MKLIFDYRVLTHKTFTGVENYAKNILDNIKEKIDINISKPKSSNKYLNHLWTHFILAFQKGNVLFCSANIAPFFIPKSKKLILTLHDVAFITNKKSFSLIFRIYYKFIIPINIKRANKIITVSNSSKKEILKYYPKSKNKIEVIYLGVSKKFKVLFKKKKNQILYVGSMNKRKNFIGVLKAFEFLEKKDFELLVIGNFNSNFVIDEESNRLLKKAKDNLKIRFLQNISDEDLIKYYNESKLFLFPSFYEGFGLPLLEAMACGTPVVCSNITSLPEVGGDAVVYCDPYDVNDIKNKIELVLNDEKLQAELIEKGLKRVKEFTWEKSAQKHIEIFKEVLKS